MSTVGTTYVLTAYTTYDSDEDSENDSVTVDITHLNPNDIGVSEITSPSSGELLSSAEPVTVTITNYGGATQYDFDVTFELNGETVTETVPGPLEGNSSMEYTFTQTVDVSVFGTYTITVYTSLDGDSDISNDSSSSDITNINCAPSMDCSFADGFQLFQLGDINNESGCEGYGDFTDQSTDVELGETYDVTMTTGYGNQYVRIWIDFNDDYSYTMDELVLDNYILGQGFGSGTYTETTQIVLPSDATLGEHTMRVKTNWNAGVPDDSCDETTYGETEDYTVNVVTSLSIGDLEFNGSNMIVYSSDNEKFTIKLTTEYNDLITFSVYDASGKIIVFNNIEKSNNSSFIYNLDMSYTSAGVYLIKMGDATVGYKTARIIVK